MMNIGGQNALSGADLSFMTKIGNVVGQADPSIPKLLVKDALSTMDLGNLSGNERKELLCRFECMTKDQDISHADANKMFDMINRFSGSDMKKPFPGAQEGGMVQPLNDWPMPGIDQMKAPGGPLLNAMVSVVSDLVGNSMNNTVFNNTVDTLLGKTGESYGSDMLGKLFDQADLSKLNADERSDLVSKLFYAQGDGEISNAEAFDISKSLYEAQGMDDPCACLPPDEIGSSWTVEEQGNGQATIELDNYTLKLNEHSSEMTLINKETGEESRIWGDPHFDMDNDGKNDVDFWGTMSLNLEDGTKITIETTPWNGNQNMTLSSKLTITKGEQAIEVNGLDQNQNDDMTIEQSNNGFALDAATKDGLDVYENPNGAKWLVRDGFSMRELTQEDTNKTKADDYNTDEENLLDNLMAFGSIAASQALQNALSNMFQYSFVAAEEQ